MKTKLIAFALILALVLTGCNHSTVPEEVKAFYIACLEMCKTDWETVANEYCYYKDERVKQQTLAIKDYLVNYRIADWDKLSDNLYVVQSYITTESFSETTYYHFVAWFDDRYYVIMNPNHIPDYLKEGLDLDQYAPSGEFVDTDDLLIN